MTDKISFEFKEEHEVYRNGEPCKHKGWLNHLTHPCEGCGRIAGRKAYDKISVDELKLFVGTGLKVKDIHKGIELELWGVTKNEICLYNFKNNSIDDWSIDYFSRSFMPIVRPISNLTEDIKDNLSYGFNYLNDTNNIKCNPSFFSLRDGLMLINNCCDIFNWLNKTGEDGESLAVELE